MIVFDGVTMTYDGADAPVLAGVDLAVEEGELCLVVGPTGSGKSTLLKLVNGLVPHFTGGRLAGRVTVDGRDTRDHPPRQLSDTVGVVLQDPLAGFVADTVEDELAYGMESLGLPGDVMRRRVEETLDLLGLVDLRDRPLLDLSGGQRQRVAIGAALTPHPKVLVLDEPTSALDPPAAEEVLAALARLVHDLGVTVLVAEHRLERVVPFADTVVLVGGAGQPLVVGPPQQVLATAPVAPPVVRLGRLAGWSPLPLTVRDARRASSELRQALTGHVPATPSSRVGDPVVVADGLVAGHGRRTVLAGLDLTVPAGQVLAVMGRNGAGKSTLLSTLAGVHPVRAGTVTIAGRRPHALHGLALVGTVALVPQEAGDLLYADTVGAECELADRDGQQSAGSTAALLALLAPGVGADTHPRDLSEGQRLALALAVMLSPQPAALLLDEPTRGLDYPTKDRLTALLRQRAAGGTAIVVATHDVELVAGVADRVVVLADGEVIADGPTAEVVVGSPSFAPQVAKVLAPQPWLTVEQVATALAGRPA